MKRGTMLAAGLVATLGMSAWLALSDPPEGEVELAVSPRRAGAGALPERSRVAEPRLTWPAPPPARSQQPWGFNPALARAWTPPPPPPLPKTVPVPVAMPTAPPAIQAPPFPYTMIGRIEDGGVVHALLGGPSRTLAVKEQDVVDGQWRIDAIVGQGVTLTWLPGGQRQDLSFRPS
jgi:hypothetical protein